MLVLLVVFNILLCQVNCESEDDDTDFGTSLIINSLNKDRAGLSDDEEYDDLQAELQAYHTALAKLIEPKRTSGKVGFMNPISTNSRVCNLYITRTVIEEACGEIRNFENVETAKTFIIGGSGSMMTTPCWELGGICVNRKLCTGFRFLSEVPGCKDRLNVCCFSWNQYRVKDWRHVGIGTVGLPWSSLQEFGGLGVLEKEPHHDKKKVKHKSKKVLQHQLEELNKKKDSSSFEDTESHTTRNVPQLSDFVLDDISESDKVVKKKRSGGKIVIMK